MHAPIIFLCCALAGSAVGYYVPRDAPYNIGPNDPFAVQVNSNFLNQPSQRLFWGNTGSNQVGGNGGLWTTLTNKFPFLTNMFGRLELPSQYSPPQFNTFVPNVPNNQYGAPGYYQATYYQQQVPTRQFVSRDVGFTDDSIIVTPPHVPISQPAPGPVLAPAPPQGGYQYRKPQIRFDLPTKSL